MIARAGTESTTGLPNAAGMFPVVAAISIPADVAIGSAITNLRPITGAWEQPAGLGKAVGFDVEISTEVEGAPKSLAGITQRVVMIWIKTYLRTNGRSQRSFWSNDYQGQFNWQNNHLILHEQPAEGSVKPVDLDVVFDPRKGTWAGTLQNEWFSGPVTLQRPFVQHNGFPIIGDWIGGAGFSPCLHVALGADSEFVIWSDIIDLPSRDHIYGGNGIGPPSSTTEWYGSLGMDPEMKYVGLSMLFFTGDDLSGDVVMGKVAADGATFYGSSAHFGNGYQTDGFTPLIWQRTTSDCSPGA